MSISGYVNNALLKFQHAPPSTMQYAPSPCIRPIYSETFQMTNDANTLAPLPPTGIKFLQMCCRNIYLL